MSKPTNKRTLEAEFCDLSWKLIEWKIAYYMPERVHASRKKQLEITDHKYDEAEQRYLTLCRELKHTNTLVHKGWPGFEDIGCKHAMIEVDLSRPSVQRALFKLARTPKQLRKQT